MNCTFVFPLWLAEIVSWSICTILGILRLFLGQGPSSLVEDKHKWARGIVLYCELGVARSGWVDFCPPFEPQSPSYRIPDTVGFAHGRTRAVAANPACTGIQRCWNSQVSVGGTHCCAIWYWLLCSFTSILLSLCNFSTLLLPFLLCPFIFLLQGSHLGTTAEVNKRHSNSWKLKSLQ